VGVGGTYSTADRDGGDLGLKTRDELRALAVEKLYLLVSLHMSNIQCKEDIHEASLVTC